MSRDAAILDWINRGLGQIAAIEPIADGIRVTTHCMYPSNGLVRVVVRGGAQSVVVSDDQGAIDEAVSAGISVDEHLRAIAHSVKSQGLLMHNGAILSPRIQIDAVSLPIIHVANASQEVARWLYEHSKIKRTRDFRTMLADFLQKAFDDRVARNAVIIGHSNTAHKFANVISLEHGRRIIVDSVAHEASSINARVVANMDVRATNDPSLEQRIVYDDEEDWSASNLNLLQVGAPLIPFSRFPDVIARLAGAQTLR
jgi:hypothetical protein